MRLPHFLSATGARVVRHVPVRIRSGPNEGLKWSLASSGRGFRSGRFEASRMQALHALVSPGDQVWDIGAHKGYVMMALSRRVGPSGSVVAFEPYGTNLWFLQRHIDWNALANVRVLPVAVSDSDGQEHFGGRGSSTTFRLGQGSALVRVATLQSLKVEEDLPTPNFVKIDVEGSEGAVLRGAGDLLSDETLLFISLHGRACYHECHDVLSERGYRFYESTALTQCLANPTLHWGADHELLAVGQNHPATEKVIKSLALFVGP